MMQITEYNYGSLLPSEDEIIAQGRDFGEHEKSCSEVAAILFPVINQLREKIKDMEANRIRYAQTNIFLINENVELMAINKEMLEALKKSQPLVRSYIYNDEGVYQANIEIILRAEAMINDQNQRTPNPF